MFIPQGHTTTQIAQTQAILRFFAMLNRGKNAERLYPNKDRPDFCYEIDCLMEMGDEFMVTSTLSLIQEQIDEKFPILINEHWPNFLAKLEKQLTKNQQYSRRHLVGMNMTLADIVIGSHILKLIFNTQAIKPQEFLTVLKKYPQTHVWATETINGTFFGWMQTQPPAGL